MEFFCCGDRLCLKKVIKLIRHSVFASDDTAECINKLRNKKRSVYRCSSRESEPRRICPTNRNQPVPYTHPRSVHIPSIHTHTLHLFLQTFESGNERVWDSIHTYTCSELIASLWGSVQTVDPLRYTFVLLAAREEMKFDRREAFRGSSRWTVGESGLYLLQPAHSANCVIWVYNVGIKAFFLHSRGEGVFWGRRVSIAV